MILQKGKIELLLVALSVVWGASTQIYSTTVRGAEMNKMRENPIFRAHFKAEITLYNGS